MRGLTLVVVLNPEKASRLTPCLVLFFKKFVLVFVINICEEGVSSFILVFDDRALWAAICTPPVSKSLQIQLARTEEVLPATHMDVVYVLAVVIVVLAGD